MKTFKIEYFVSGTTTATDWIWLTTDDKKSKDKDDKPDKPNDDRDPKSPNNASPFFD